MLLTHTWDEPMLLDIQRLESGYGKVTILHGVDIHVDSHELIVLLGPNGAGKTTLLKTLAGHLKFTAGAISLNGGALDRRPDASQRAMRGIGYVPQENNVFAPLSVIENLRVSLVSRRDEEADRLAEVFDRFPILHERRDQRAGTLSGGERQILAITSALLQQPDLLLLDEPTSGLSPLFVDMIVDWMTELVAGNTGVIWVVEQNPEPVLQAASRAYVLAGGRIVKEAPSSDLLRSGELERVLLGGSSARTPHTEPVPPGQEHGEVIEPTKPPPSYSKTE